VALALAAWFATQAMIGHRVASGDGIIDLVHRWSAPWHDYFFEHPQAADLLLIASSAMIDAVGIFLILSSIFGRSLRPLLALLMLFALRQACQGLCSLPTPEGMIWRSPGVPSLLVTYGVSTDLFFSGHTGLAVLGAIELARSGKPWLKWLGLAIAVFEAGTVLILRAHWTMDVFAGAMTAIVVSVAANSWAPKCDAWLSRFTGTSPANC
jgi:membrane-associated phospholipid phosphatase